MYGSAGIGSVDDRRVPPSGSQHRTGRAARTRQVVQDGRRTGQAPGPQLGDKALPLRASHLRKTLSVPCCPPALCPCPLSLLSSLSPLPFFSPFFLTLLLQQSFVLVPLDSAPALPSHYPPLSVYLPS